ncbi:retrovirus-related pol polyprotein from transposon TNT 1-94 [Tanacetum coccineum]
MLMCKQAEKSVPLCAEQSDWLDDTDEEIDEQELEAHYSFMAKIQEVVTTDSRSDAEPLEKVQYDAEYNVFANKRQYSEQPKSINDTYVVEKVDSNVIPDSSSMCDNDNQADQNAEECDDERVVLTNLIANLKLDIDENKKIQSQLKKSNTSLSHELKECNSTLEECKSSLKESNRTRDRYLGALHDLEVELAKYKRYNDCTLENDRLERKLKETQGLLAQKEINSKEALKQKAMKFLWKRRKTMNLKDQLQDKNIAISDLKKLIEKMKEKTVDTKFDKPSVVRQPNALRIPKPSVLGKPTPFPDSLERKSFSKTKSVTKTNVLEGLSKPVTTQILPQTARQAVRNTNVIKLGMYQIDTRTTKTRASQLSQTSRNTNSRVSTTTGVIHRTSVSRPQLRSTQMKEKVMHNNGQVKFKKTKVEDHQRISSISNKTKSLYACNDSLKSRTSNVNAVCATCEKCVFNLNHDACVSKFTNDVNARTKKPKEVPISTDHFGNDQFAPILGYGDLVQGNITINRVYYVEGLNYNLFLVGQFCDADLEVAFRKSTCFVRDLQGNNLLTGNCGSDLYIITLQETTSSTPICFMAKASPTQACKKNSFKTKTVSSSKGRLNLLHMDLCGPMRIESINGKKYILAEAIVTACYTQNKSLIIPRHEKTPYHIINGRKPSLKHLHIFGCTCYITRDGENLDKMKEKGDPCILVGYSAQSKGYRVYNKRTRLIVESIHIKFNEIKELSKASDYDNSGPVPQLQKTSDHNRLELETHDYKNEPSSSKLVPNVSPSADTDSSQQELDFLFSPLFEEYFTTGNRSVPKSSSLSL